VPFRTHNALSSDFIEIFRAEINHAILGIFRQKLLEKSDFSLKNGGVYLTFNGRKKIWSEFVSLISVLNPKLKKEIAHIRAITKEKRDEKV
jgi:CRISPR/Cas system-associated endonuclease Cas1